MKDWTWDEERANLHQRIGHLEDQVSKMTKWRDDGELNALALRVARLIEDLYAQNHKGGRDMRLAKSQAIVREAVREALTGSRAWDTWSPSSVRLPPQEPS